MASMKPLSAAELYQRCDPASFNFETTAELEDLDQVIGQPRAVEAVQFGIGIQQEGYNLYALGPAGTGKRTIVQQFFEARATGQPVPSDWCYVHNFTRPHQPKAIQLPAGMGAQFRQDLTQLVEGLRSAITAAFDSDEYRSRRQVIEEEFQQRQEKSLQEIQAKAQQRDLMIIRTPAGLVFAPVKEGEVVKPEDFQKLPEEQRTRIQADVEELQEDLQNSLQQVPHLQRELLERVRTLNREITDFAIGGLFAELQEKYRQQAEIVSHLEQIQADVVDNASTFTGDGEDEGSPRPAPVTMPGALAGAMSPLARRYQANLLVDHSSSKGAPVIYEDNPNLENLIGRVEHIAQLGALVTDFHLIKPGALHRANGGFLILDARKVLLQPYSWEALKRALQARQIRIESLGQMMSLVSTVSQDPEPIPLNLKVALLGDRMLYYLLSQADPDFHEHFKVVADFDDQMERSPESQALYARLIATLARKYGLRPFHKNAVARVIEHSARKIGDSNKLSAQMVDIADLIREADYWADRAGQDTVRAEDIEQAIDAQTYRIDLVRERLQEGILNGTILIDTEGEKVGQINGLSVLQLGDFSFGRPSRITARVRAGKGEVINIEREVELSGPIHSKGVLILASFLGARFSSDRPLSLSASLVFEQSYSGVEGDSASSAELYALLSAISGVPVQQCYAVTGSVNQHGQVQAIGGVNEKVEGFFSLCQIRGLTGHQGVLIPAANRRHLMLRQEVVAAVEAGQFHIFPIETIDQGIEILTGLSAGEPDGEGNYPEDSLNGRVKARLDQMAEAMETRQKEA